MRAVFDPLVIEDETGAPLPYLLESFEANDDFTIWTLRMRPGIRFHDGTPAGADALAIHVQNLKAGALTGQLLRRIESWEVVDDLTLAVYSSAPFAGLIGGLTGQFGYLPAPSQYADPDGAANPVGTGPFVFKSWIPDAELVVERNPSYWRTGAEGNALPYLDRIVFRPIIEPDARKLALRDRRHRCHALRHRPGLRRLPGELQDGRGTQLPAELLPADEQRRAALQ